MGTVMVSGPFAATLTTVADPALARQALDSGFWVLGKLGMAYADVKEGRRRALAADRNRWLRIGALRPV